MITVSQRARRGPRPVRPVPRAALSAAHRAALARRLTPRDRWLLHLVHEHRVLTTPQITALGFPSARSARQRLRELFCWNVLDRFQPFVPRGSAPQHYVLAPAGAAVLAAAHGLDPAALGYRRDRVLGLAHSLRLAHTVAVNDWFTALVARARHRPGERLVAWWSEARCARHFGDLVRPDGYGRWAAAGRQVEFFLELDLGTEPLPRVAAKLPGYAALAAATALSTPLLFWLPSTARETAARRLLSTTHQQLDDPAAVPVATAAADQPHTPCPGPADPVWLPLPATGASARRALHHLAEAWPHLPPLVPGPPQPGPPHQSPGMLPPPVPMPPGR